MAKTFKDFVTEATYRTRTGNTLSTVSGGKPNLPNPNAVPGSRAAPGTIPPQTTTSKVKSLASTISGTKQGGWQEKPAAVLSKIGNSLPVRWAGNALGAYATAADALRDYRTGREQQGQTVPQALGRGAVGGYGTWAGMARGAALGARLGSMGYAAGPLVGTVATGAGILGGAIAGSEVGNKLLTKAYDTGIKIKQQGFQKAVVEPVTSTAKDLGTKVKELGTNLPDYIKKGAVAPRLSRTYQSSSGQGG